MPSSTKKNTTSINEADVALPSIEFNNDKSSNSITNRNHGEMYDPEKAEWGINWGNIRQPDRTPTSEGLDGLRRRGSQSREFDDDRQREGSGKPTTDA